MPWLSCGPDSPETPPRETQLLGPAQDELAKARDYYLEHPELGKPLSQRMRSIAISHFPYSVIYRLTPEAIFVQAIAHQRRRPGYWAKRR